jgi:hypothetical protein
MDTEKQAEGFKLTNDRGGVEVLIKVIGWIRAQLEYNC